MFKGRAELIDGTGNVVATFHETCHGYGTTVATVRLRGPLAPFTLEGTESLAIFAKGIGQPAIFVEASDPAGTEIYEFHGKSAIGCVPEDTGVALVKSPGGDLGTSSSYLRQERLIGNPRPESPCAESETPKRDAVDRSEDELASRTVHSQPLRDRGSLTAPARNCWTPPVQPCQACGREFEGFSGLILI